MQTILLFVSTEMPIPLPVPWLTLMPSLVFPKYELVHVEYISPENPVNNGSTNIYVRANTEMRDGTYQPGVKFWQDWKDDRASELTKPILQAPDFNGVKYGLTFYMSGDSSFDPNKGQVGPYAVYPDLAGDRITGLGLPLKRHVQYLLTWQWTDKPTPPPIQPKWVITAQSATHIVLDLQVS